MEENKPENNGIITQNNSVNQIAGAILIAGVLIAGAVLLKGSSATPRENLKVAPLIKINKEDYTIGNPNAKVAVVLYEDFQCPFCGKLVRESEQPIRDTYVREGKVLLVYRDYAFLGPESIRTAESARCAGDQGKFWEYHDYLYARQNGENQGNFSDPRLKSFAKDLGLNTDDFNQCLDGKKYEQAILNAKTEADGIGVQGTPKGFILLKGKVVSTIDGAEPFGAIKQKIDNALK